MAAGTAAAEMAAGTATADPRWAARDGRSHHFETGASYECALPG